MNFTNQTNLSLTMALWLAFDTYDHEPEGAPEGVPIISVTTLLKPTKALILANRIPKEEQETELQDLASARLGQAVHASVENALYSREKMTLLKKLGFAEKFVDKLRINPTAESLKQYPDIIPIYLEKRAYRMITCSDGLEVCISGKFDQIIAGSPEDNKVTSSYKFMKTDDSEDSEYGLQMSLYKWLNPEIITADIGRINFIIKDWKRSEAARNPNYPSHQVIERPINLKDETAAEEFIRNKLDEIRANTGLADQNQMVRCSDEELWRSPDVYKYYASEASAKAGKRATKNFDSYAAAMQHKATQGKGEIVIQPGEVRRCNYCDAAPLCMQRLEYQSQ